MPVTSVTVRIAGANGDGIESAGAMLGKAAARNGMEVFGNRGYQSVIRGGHVWYQLHIGDEKLYGFGDSIDILIALNEDAIKNQKGKLGAGATIIYDPTKTTLAPDDFDPSCKFIGIPLLDIAMQTSGNAIMRNIVAIGAVLRIIGIDINFFDGIVREMFSRKGEEVVGSNIKAATSGYNYEGVDKQYSINGDGKRRLLIDGNTAISMGAYAAGCKYYAAYPMTPASGILHWFAAHANKGVLYKQTEDEIAAINSAIGAASAGVRSMCGTSGGGFSLMVEGLGLAGMLEVPIVVVESQRTGPSTGLPTKTEQGDLQFVMHAAQGEFPRIVVAPTSVEECFYTAADAFNLAERYQCPVVILMDQFLSEHMETVESFDLDAIKIDRGKVADSGDANGRFKRYLITEDGISKRSIPGEKGLSFIAASDEHNEYGDLVSDVLAGLDESVEMRKRMHEKRMKKIETMLGNETLFAPKIEHEEAKHFLVTFGSTVEAAREAAGMLRGKGASFGLIYFNYLMPLDRKRTESLLGGRDPIDVECNLTAQLAGVIASNTGIMIEKRILKYDGEAITAGEIVEEAMKLI